MRMVTRWWWVALGAAGFLAGRASAGPGPDRHWSARNGEDWRALGPEAQSAYTDGFLAGAGFAQAAADPTGAHGAADSAGLQATMATLHETGRFRFPYAANVYVTRINDYYWWVDHRPLPTWYAFWEVNTSLTRPTNDPAH
ncbi:MAG: hypothetical protein ABI603_16990 [Acidobacteriota bacterium]